MKFGQTGAIGLVLGIILLVAVALPVTLNVVANANSTGYLDATTSTILNLLGLMIGVGALAYIAMGVMGGGRR